MSASEGTFPTGDVVARLNFFRAPDDGADPINIVVPNGLPQRNYSDDTRSVLIHDLRGQEESVNLDDDAVLLISGVPTFREEEFLVDGSIKENYYPKIERLLLENIPGSHRVVIFDHTIRRADQGAKRNPVTRVHIDQTVASAVRRVRRHVPEDAEKLLSGRYRIVNVWRPLNKKPVESFPLAFASSSSLNEDDAIPITHRYPDGYTGQTAGIAYRDTQKWYYWSGMDTTKGLLLQCFDSNTLKANSKVRGGRLPHAAFDDPRTRIGAEGRESIEVRALVFG